MGSSSEHIFRSKLPDIPIPDHLSLTQYCFEHIAQFSQNPCLLQSHGKPYTYSEVELYTRRIAAGFSNLGINKGDVVMLLLPNCVEFVLLFLGLATRGAIATPCNPFSTAPEVAKQVNASGAKLIITQAAFAEKLGDVATAADHTFRVMTTDEAAADMNQLHISVLMETDASQSGQADIHPDDAVALLYSSGTTGLPKGVLLTHQNLITNVAQQVDGENPNRYTTSDDVVLCVIPLFHVYALVVLLLCAVRKGASVVVMGKYELKAMLDVIQSFKVTMAFVVPPIVLALTKNPIVENYDLSSIRMFMSAASTLGKGLTAALQARAPQAIVGQGYGLTEASPMVSMSLSYAKYPFSGKHGSCGTVLRNSEMKIVEVETGKSLPRNKSGEIYIKGGQIMKGYLDDPKATANAIDKDGFLHTGDVGFVDDDDEIFIVDRVKEIMKVKGFQVSPAELEAILLSHPAITDAACTSKKHEECGEVPIAFVVKAPNSTINEISIKEFVAKQVIFYKKLHKVYFVENIPKSAAGKILRKELQLRISMQDNHELEKKGV